MSIFEAVADLTKSVFGNMTGKDKKHILKDSMILFAAFNAPFVPIILIPILEKCGYDVVVDHDKGIGIVKGIRPGKDLDTLREFKKLVDEGILSIEEFSEIKAKVLHLKESKESGEEFDEALLTAYIEVPPEIEGTDFIAIEA